MHLKEKLAKLKSTKKFSKTPLNKYGLGTFLSIDSPKSLTQEIEEIYTHFYKELSLKNDPNILNLLFKIIKLILILEEENVKESINEYKKLCKNIFDLTKKEVFNIVFFNVRFHYLQLETNLVYGGLESKRSVDDKCLFYFLREYKYFGELVRKSGKIRLVSLDDLEDEIGMSELA